MSLSGTMNARLTPDRSPRFTRRDLPGIPSPNTRRALPSLLRCSTSVTGSPVASAFRVWTSPCIRRLVATYGRIVFVILRAACSLPAALHPASQRRSYLQLSGMSIPRERTFTSLIAPAPGRTDTGLRRYDDGDGFFTITTQSLGGGQGEESRNFTTCFFPPPAR